MVDQATLSLSIDASGAKEGAAEFSRAADDIKRKAVEMGRALDRGSEAFRNMRAVANDNSRALNSSVRSLRDADSALRELGDAAVLTRDRMRELQSSSDQPSRGLFNKFGKEIRGLFDLIIELGVELGVSARTMSVLVTVIDAITVAVGVAGLTGNIGGLVSAIGGLAAAVGGLPLLVLAGAASVATGAFFLFRNSADELMNSLDSFNGVLRASNELLDEAAKSGGVVSQDRREIVVEKLEQRLQRSLQDRQKILDRLEERRAKLDELGGGKGAASLKAQIKAQENRLRMNADSIKTLQDQLNKINALPDSAVPAKPVSFLPLDRGDLPEDSGAASKLEEERIAAEQLERAFAALQHRLDPLSAATRSYEAELKLLEAAERANLLTQDELVELTEKLNKTTLDARDPLAAIRRELEEERRQLMLTDDEREISNRLLEIEARLKSAGADVSDEVRQSLEKELRAIQEQDEAERRGKAVEASIEQIKDAAADSFKDVIKGTESIGDAFQKLADRITDILLDLALDELLKGGTGFSDLFGAVFGGIGSIFGGGAPANLAGPAGVGILPIGHQGGVIGQDRFPLRRFHQGGFPGLRPDEIPIIAQRGEEVLTRNDPRHRDNGAVGGGNVVVNVSFPNARNTGEARQAGSEITAKAA